MSFNHCTVIHALTEGIRGRYQRRVLLNRVPKIDSSLGRPSVERHSRQGVAKCTGKDTNDSIVHA